MKKVCLNSSLTFLSPESMDQIEPNLYLGTASAARSEDLLQRNKITHILTINDYPQPSLKNITTKFIRLSDDSSADLLSYFEETNAFINEGLSKGAVLVHCFFGISRSATVVIAYVMKKYQLSFEEAFKKVQKKRRQVHPNDGFVAQLRLYHQIGYKLDPNNVSYKLYRLRRASDGVRKEFYLPKQFMDLVKPDPEETPGIKDVYCCKKCQKILATGDNLMSHKTTGKICSQMYFFEPLEWMKVTNRTDATLFCPKCDAQVGSFKWNGATFCPCGAKVHPAFQLTPTLVEYARFPKM